MTKDVSFGTIKKRYTGAILLLLLLFLYTGCNKESVHLNDETGAMGKEYGPVELIPVKYKKDIVKEEREIINTVILKVPEGYVRDEDIPGLYKSIMHPLDSSNIYYECIKDDTSVSTGMTKEEYIDLVKGSDLVVDEFSDSLIDGIPAFKIRSHYTYEDDDISMLTYLILASDTYVITFTQSYDDELLDTIGETDPFYLIKKIP